MSLRADAAILLTDISGSCTHNTNNGTAPASTTACAKSMKIKIVLYYSVGASSHSEGPQRQKSCMTFQIFQDFEQRF